ncbi:cell wall synthesis KRE9KNH1 [Ascoidea rubescens DSM 1968]|uniref:Cell wall synthesis KRE9KNH1 n=1 Tax=Ascoidea rubescens DSM 1968 TaxID=1344418 RepID=A0A1D2VND0_9ASCO|nr:cell wall synthesis KRE9KNH1 [Ascoidea rubescens DSM 1968]ODV63099.1 cell wall synthesis KRE9KNH1 [Ascoidea rubescens DSM 1968]
MQPVFFVLTLLTFVQFFFHFSNGDVSLSKPVASQTFTASGGVVNVDVAWVDSGGDPSVDEVTSYTFTLCTGRNSDITAISVIAASVSTTSNTYTCSIDSSLVSSGVYYIQVYALYSTGYSIHYTKRFRLSGMTGTLESTGALTDDSPSAQYSFAGTDTDTDTETTVETEAVDTSASFKITYTLQTGRTRFAPMQTQPGSTVTATTWRRKFPTSAVTYYSTVQPSPVVYSTITPGWSYSRTSYFNYASYAPYPSENGGWYSANFKLVSPSKMDTNTLKKRWFDDLY